MSGYEPDSDTQRRRLALIDGTRRAEHACQHDDCERRRRSQRRVRTDCGSPRRDVGKSWDEFESFLALRGDAGPRVTYPEGTLELISPSHDHEKKERPDLAIEVVWTSGGIQKLEVYRRLGVGEVWFWKDDALRFYVLVGGGYEERATSTLIPEFDCTLANEMLGLSSLSEVKRALRERLG